MVVDRSTAIFSVTSAGSDASRRGSSARTPSIASMMFAPGWREMTITTPGRPLIKAALRRSSTESSNFGDVGKPHSGAIAIGDDQIPVLRRLCRLIVGVDLIVEIVVFARAFGAIGVGGRQRRADIFQPDPVAKHCTRIDLHAHGRKRRAGDVDRTDSGKAVKAAAGGDWRRDRRADPACGSARSWR